MLQFWKAGFDGTTYADLEMATGQHRQSLVYAFGDKEQLFHAALGLYIERRVQKVCDTLVKAKTPSKGINRAFDLWLGDASRETARGCLAVNVAGELGGRSRLIAERIEAARVRLVEAFSQAFRQARLRNELRLDTDPVLLAEMAVALGDGALLHARNNRSAKTAKRAFQGFLSSVLR